MNIRKKLELAAGSRLVEIRNDQCEPYSTRVTIRPGETTPLEVLLKRKP